jgi:TRAP transporter TAXI family solute receptor
MDDRQAWTRRTFLTTVAGAAMLWPLRGAFSQEDAPLRFLRIGTASTAGTYFPIGGILANAISHPPGSRPCARGGSCGVPNLIAVVQSTNGSVDNVRRLAGGALDSGLVQSDVAYWAYYGKGLFEDQGPVENLRAIANLYPEAVHLVVREDTRVRSVPELAGKRISLDRKGSGTRVDAELILKAFGMSKDDIQEVDVPAGQAADMMREGELDGFFFVAGTPANAISNLAEDVAIDLLPLFGPEVVALREAYPFFATHSISPGTYQNVAYTHTLSVGAQWIIDAGIDEDTVYQITRALWHPNTRRLLDNGHPKGKLIRLETALDGLGVPLHPGARRWYIEAGEIEPDEQPGPSKVEPADSGAAAPD